MERAFCHGFEFHSDTLVKKCCSVVELFVFLVFHTPLLYLLRKSCESYLHEFMADVDECDDSHLSNCSHNANCTDTIGGYECFCSSGYTGDGFVCGGECRVLGIMIAQQIVILYSDIDECSASQDDCHTNASCSNTEGSYGCQCVPGFTGDGFTCSSNKYNIMIPWCQHHTDLFFSDIDECVDSNLNNCSMNANCSDSIGSYDCTCSAGYVGDGYFCDGKSVNKLGQISFYIMLFSSFYSSQCLLAFNYHSLNYIISLF